MFEPLPSFIRQERVRQDLSQERLAKMAQVSRGQLVAFEKGEQNVTIAFLIKIAKALDLTELPIGDLWLRATPPDRTALLVAADAIDTARKVLSHAAAGVEELEAAASFVDSFVDQARTPSGAGSRPRSTAKAAEGKRAR